ncbi:MAG: putative Ig domain-containing protein [Acidimicrobiia bacterium]
MIKKALLAVIVFAALVAFPQPATAQTAEPSGGIESLAIDADQRTDRVGLVDPATGAWHQRGQGGQVTSFFYGNPGDFPMAGDWDCDGVDTPGLYRQSDGFVYLRNSNSQGVADIRFFFGNPGDIPLAGDFDNDGCDTVSIYRAAESRIYVINELGANDGGLGAADFNYIFGNPGDKPFVGDFDGDGVDTVGLHRESTGFVYFRNSHTQGIANAEFFFGDPGDRLVAGDWGVLDNIETPAIFRPSDTTFYFRHTNTQGIADETVAFGQATFLPIAGRWKVSDLPPPPSISDEELPPALVSSAYSARVPVTGGLNPNTFEMTSGPAWIKISASGVITGTPPATGTVNVGVRVTDRHGRTDTATLPIQVVNGCENRGLLPLNQCQALVQLFKSTNGYGWNDLTGWLIDVPCSDWDGITCVANSVTEISLAENNLNGTIPNLAALTGLVTLDLAGNSIRGAVPNVTPFPGLTTLNVGVNRFTSVHASVWSHAALRNLDISSNNLSGAIPSGINLPALRTLNLSTSGLGGGIPVALYNNSPQLIALDLSENAFTGQINAAIGALNLQELDLSDNGMSGPIPNAFLNLQDTITDLALTSNGCFTASQTVTKFIELFDMDWDDGCLAP